jgi:hypothetical protein
VFIFQRPLIAPLLGLTTVLLLVLLDALLGVNPTL